MGLVLKAMAILLKQEGMHAGYDIQAPNETYREKMVEEFRTGDHCGQESLGKLLGRNENEPRS